MSVFLRIIASDYFFDIFSFVIKMSVFLRIIAFDYFFGIFSFVIKMSVFLRIIASDYSFGIFKLFLFFINDGEQCLWLNKYTHG